MDAATFEKELAKYKVVRSEDHYTPKLKSNPLTIKPSPRPQPSEPGKQKLHLQGGNNADAKFWDMMEAVAAGALSAEETATFIGNMKKVYADLPEMVNLEDLNVAASLIQTN